MQHGLGASIWFAYILPSALVIDFALDRYVRFVDCPFSFLVMSVVRVTSLGKVLAGSNILFL